MAKLFFNKAEENLIAIVFIQDSSSSVGAGLGSLDENSSIAGGYVKRNGTGVALAVDENVTTEGTYQAPSTAAQVRIGTVANMPTGFYELHFHNSLLTLADYLVIGLGGASNMAPLNLEFRLHDPIRANLKQINDITAAAEKLAQGALALTVVSAVTGTLSTTEVSCDSSEGTDDHFNGLTATFVTGVLTGQGGAISDYDGASKVLTFSSALTEAPSNGDKLVIS